MVENNILVIGDTHQPFEHRHYLSFCKETQKKYKCKTVVHIGDLVDNNAISYHEHDPNGWSPADEKKEADKHLKPWFKAFPTLKLCRGNHDCYCEETDVLTLNGWKKGVSLTDQDSVATLNISNNNIEYQKPTAIIRKEYNGEMIKIKSRQNIDLLVTPSHRMLISSKDTKISDPIYSFTAAHRLNGAYRYFAVSGDSPRSELADYSDNLIRLLGWVLTDGGQESNRFIIYQSKKENFGKIRNILSCLGIEYKERVRHRDITHVCGKILVKPPRPQHEFAFLLEDPIHLQLIDNCKKVFPYQIKHFSKRQFNLLLDSILDGDGTKFWETRSPNRNSCVLYGTKRFLENIQAMCVQNKYMATLIKYRDKDWKLNIIRDKIKVGVTDSIECVDYQGLVWCASVPNTTLVVRRNGIVSIQGNCLVDRKSKTIGLPRCFFAPYRDIWNFPKTWEDSFEFVINGVLYKHGTGLSGKYGHVNAAINSRMKTVIGHLHSVLGIEWLVSSRDRIFGMCVGSGIDRKAYAFAYGKDFPRKPVLGCGVVLNNGEDALPIPMKME